MAWANPFSTRLDVDTANQYWSIADASQTGLNVSADLTIACWMRRDGTGDRILVSRRTVATQGYEFWTQANTINLDAWDGSNHAYTKAQTFTADVWYHVAVVFTESTSTAEFFINGASIGSHTLSGGLSAGADIFAIGSVNSGGTYMDGYIDDVRIWARALADAEITSLYGNGSTFANGANLVGWWKFDNNGNDSSGNSNTLTGQNSPTFSTTVPWDYQLFNEDVGVPVETVTLGMTMNISASEIAGAPVESNSIKSGWSNQSKSTTTWTNQTKS